MSHNKARPAKGKARRIQVRALNVLDVASKLCEALNTACSLKIFLLIKHGEFAQVARAGIDPAGYTDNRLPHLGFPGVATFMADSQAVAFLAKYEKLPTGIDTEKVAIKKFIESELQCKHTNERIRLNGHVESPRANSVLHRAMRKISDILGDVPTLAELKFKFGPGANYGIKGDTSSYAKLNHGLECNIALVDILPEFLGEFPGWISDPSSNVTVVHGSRLTFVPKNAKTDRPICIEPCLNTLFQKGVGSFIRNRLRRWGVDLRDQSLNQHLAMHAVTRDLATVDFASASDTISYLLVYDLLPFDWAVFLDAGRSPTFEFEGKTYPFEKFSSMGNAYTFELESLIFFALATSCCEELDIRWATGSDGNLAVYGDDVIIPQSVYALYSECAEVCGFSINTEKSFAAGLFFESCGKDFFNGTDVRPIFIKKDPVERLDMGVYYVANQIKRWIARFASACGQSACSSTYRALWSVYSDVVDCVPRPARLYGPEGFGDGHLVVDAADVLQPHPDGWDGYIFNSKVTMPELFTPEPSSSDSIEWPMSYALYNNAYDTSTYDAYMRHEYDVNFRLLHESGSAPQFSKGYSIRGRERVKKAALYVSRRKLAVLEHERSLA